MSERENGSIRINWTAGTILLSVVAAAISYGANANKIAVVEKRLTEEVGVARQSHADFQKAISEDSRNIATLQAEFVAVQKEIEALLNRRFQPQTPK